MPSKRSGDDLILFSSQDPRALVNWLCEEYGLTAVLQAVSQYRSAGEGADPTKRAYKRRGRKPGAKKGASKKAGGKKGMRGRPRKNQDGGGNEAG